MVSILPDMFVVIGFTDISFVFMITISLYSSPASIGSLKIIVIFLFPGIDTALLIGSVLTTEI